MRRKNRQQKGFTLIEMLIAMAVFTVFLGVLINSYANIVRDQREANEYRIMYSEVRRVFDKITEDVRNGAIYYASSYDENMPYDTDYTNAVERLTLIHDGGESFSVFGLSKTADNKNDLVYFKRALIGDTTDEQKYSLTSCKEEGLCVKELQFFISPAADPYLPENVYADSLKFQPKVTVYASFEKEKISAGNPFEVDFQTTISSRYYGPAPQLSPELGNVLVDLNLYDAPPSLRQ